MRPFLILVLAGFSGLLAYPGSVCLANASPSYAYLNATSYAAGETLVVYASSPSPLVRVCVERIGLWRRKGDPQ